MSDIEGHVTSTFTVDDPGLGVGDDAPKNNYNICQISGWKSRPHELLTRWDGIKVLPQYFENRHPQDYIRVRADKNEGASRPEADDTFVGTITPDDL